MSIASSTVIFVALYFEVFLLITLFEKRSGRKKRLSDSMEINADEEFTPKVTVIIPVYNEEATVESTLESLFALDYPQNQIAIIIVNDGSTDGTAKVLEKYSSDPRIRIFTKENGGKYTALNFGIEKAETEFIGCLDADSFVEKHALRRIMSHFKDASIMAVTPSMLIDKPKGIIRHMQKAEYSYGNFIRQALSMIGAIHITPGPFSFFRKEVFERIGPYKRAHNTEDMEMAMRMQKNKMKIVNATNALVYTVGPGSALKLYKQRVRWVSGFIGNLIDYRDMLFSRQFGDLGLLVLPFSVFGIIMAFVFTSITIYHLILSIVDTVVRFKVVGFALPTFRLDWFYLNTSILSILSIMFLSLIIALSMYGDRTTSGRWRFSMSVLYFTFLYSFIAPFWLLRSIYNNLLSKEASWR